MSPSRCSRSVPVVPVLAVATLDWLPIALGYVFIALAAATLTLNRYPGLTATRDEVAG